MLAQRIGEENNSAVRAFKVPAAQRLNARIEGIIGSSLVKITMLNLKAVFLVRKMISGARVSRNEDLEVRRRESFA